MLGKNGTTLVILIIFLCVLVLGAIIGYNVTSKAGSTELYFNADSNLPDSAAALKNGKIEKEALNVLKVGKPYDIAFTVKSNEKKPIRYRYVVESKLKRQEELFTLNPGKKKVVVLTIKPSETDKWAFDRVETSTAINVFDLSDDSWMGERVDHTVISGDSRNAYSYAPVAVNVSGYGKILNLNVTLDELKARPYRQEHTVQEIRLENKERTVNSVSLYVKNKRLILESNTTTSVYKIEPELFKVTLFNLDESRGPATKPGSYNTTTYDVTGKGRVPISIGFVYRIE